MFNMKNYQTYKGINEMANIHEEIVIIRLTKLLKSSENLPTTSVVSNQFLSEVEKLSQTLVGNEFVVEVERTVTNESNNLE